MSAGCRQATYRSAGTIWQWPAETTTSLDQLPPQSPSLNSTRGYTPSIALCVRVNHLDHDSQLLSPFCLPLGVIRFPHSEISTTYKLSASRVRINRERLFGRANNRQRKCDDCIGEKVRSTKLTERKECRTQHRPDPDPSHSPVGTVKREPTWNGHR